MNDYLYSLIVELDRHERLHITNTLKQNKKNTILLFFFNYLCELNKFDESQIKTKVKNETLKKFYPQYKKKLYDAIIKAMRNYNKNELIEKKLYDLLNDITFLFGKGRVNEANDLISKGVKISHKHQIFELEIVFWKWRLQTVSKINNFLTKKKHYDEIQMSVKKCLKLNEKLTQNRLKHYTYLFEKKNKIINLPPKKRSVAAQKLLASLDLKIDDDNTSEINYGYHLLHYQIYILENNLPKVKYHLEKAVNFIKTKPYKEAKDYYNYGVGLANLTEMAFLDRSIDKMEGYLNELIELDRKIGINSLLKSILNNYIPIFQLHFNILTNQSDNDKSVKNIKIQINNDKNTNPIRSSLCLAAATHYWLKKDHSKALDFILKFKDFQNESNYFYAYKFLELIIYYELKEYQLLESKLRSIYRYLSEQDHYGEVERALLRTFKKGIHTKNRDKTKRIIRELVDLFKLSDQNESVIALRQIYFEEWFEAELKGISIQELLKEKQLLSLA